MTTDPETRLRADARRNREQILAAAKTMFATHGFDAPMEEIARRAGVGVGTLYRRFPDREALIRAVARETFTTMEAQSRAAVEEEEYAWNALLRVHERARSELELTMQLIVTSPTAAAVIGQDEAAEQFKAATMETLDGIVRTAQDEGSMRADVDSRDVALLLSLLLHRGPMDTGEDTDALMPRALTVILDGLRARPDTTPLGQVPTVGDLP